MYIDDIEIADAHVVYVGRLNAVVKSRGGLLCLNRHSPIGRSIFFYGEHGWNELSFCKHFISKGEAVLDVGAHQGTHTIAFAEMVGDKGAVYAFEPQRVLFLNLCASAALNSLTNVYAYNMAVGQDYNYVRIVHYDYAKRAHFSGMKISRENTGEEVLQITLDAFVKERGVRHLGFVKIDVEGMELEVLLGAENTILTEKPRVYCEYHLTGGDQKRANLRDFLDRHDYSMFIHEPAGFNANNFYGYRDDRFRGGKDHNAICIHRDQLAQYEAVTRDLKRIL